MAQVMASGRVRLKGHALLAQLQINMHALSLDEKVSYPTLHKYLNNADELNSFSAEVLYAILVKGMGKTPDEIEDMRLGDVFEVVKSGNGST